MTGNRAHLEEQKGLATSTEPRLEMRLGGLIIVLFFGVFIGWAALAPLDAGAYAPGRVTVSGNRQAVQHQEGGIISALYVSESDNVVLGQVLLEINSGNLRATERGVAAKIFSLLAQRERMIAERDRRPSFAVPAEFENLSDDDLGIAEGALRLQRNQFLARQRARQAERGVLDQRISQLHERIGGYRRQLNSNQEQQRLVQEELAGVRSLAERGYAPLSMVRALERTAASLEGEEGSLVAQAAAANEQIGEARLQLLGIEAQLDEELTGQLDQAELQLHELTPRLSELRAEIARATVRSPAAGQVVGLSVFTAGGVVRPSELLMEIVPDDASQVIVAQVDPAHIDSVRAGLETEVRFPGMRREAPPVILGQVTSVSGDSIRDDQTGRSYFRVEVLIPPENLERLGPEAREIRPGTPVELIILLRRRTVLSYIVEPIARNMWRSAAT